MWDSVELSEDWFHVLVTKADKGALVSHLITVIRGAEYCDALFVMVYAVAFVFDFMRPYYKL